MDLIAEMRGARTAGLLVPFLGSGMSMGVCCSWPGMVAALGERARLPPRPADAPPPGDRELTERAEGALRVLLHGGEKRATSIRAVLAEKPDTPTEPTRALAEFSWPLVLTTNYDDLYPAAAHATTMRRLRLAPDPASTSPVAVARRAEVATPPVVVVGRGPRDCHRVLSSLRHPAPPLLWALQGYLGGQATITTAHGRTRAYLDWLAEDGPARVRGPSEELGQQVVVGHADYRRVAQRHEDFRRAFAEVFRSRSLLFLGSGLRDRYLLDLFSQIIELYGPSPRQHYAVVARSDGIDGDMLRDQYGIRVHVVDDHARLPAVIRAIAADPIPARTRRWSVSIGPDGTDVEIVEGQLPALPASEHERCLVVSGGGSGDGPPRIATGSSELLVEMGLLPPGTTGAAAGAYFVPDEIHENVWRFGGPDSTPVVLAARVRTNPSTTTGRAVRPVSSRQGPDDARLAGERGGRLWRDVRLAPFAMRQVLDVARRAGCTRVHSTIWGAGRLRVTPVSYAVFEMVRGWGAVEPSLRLPLTIHVNDEATVDDLRSGRLSPARAVDAASRDLGTGTIEYWFEVVVDGVDALRTLRTDAPGTPVGDVLAEYAVTDPDCRLDLEPRPCLGWGEWSPAEVRRWEAETGRDMSLERLGLLHGATFRVELGERDPHHAPS